MVLAPWTANRGAEPSSASTSRSPFEARPSSDVEVGDVEGVVLDEFAARLDDVAHQGGEDLFRLVGVGDLNLQQAAGLRIERRLPELLGIHLAEALVAVD